MGEAFLHGQGSAGGGKADTRFKALVEGTLAEVNDNTITSIRDYAFRSCNKLTSVDFPLVTSISNYAFYGCSSLTSVDFPLVTSIGQSAFYNDSKLTSVIIRTGQVCRLLAANALSNTPIASGTGYIYVPSALIEDYKVATNWSTYAAQFRALEEYTADGTVTGELDPTKI